MKAAIYARVSTTDQDCGMQLRELREYSQRRGWDAAEYVDTGFSGAKVSRPALDRLMRDARLKRFDVVLVWKLDRWGRSVRNLVESIGELKRLGVRWIATTQNLDTDESNPTSQLILHILASVAEFEREMIRERVKAGMNNARLRGKRLGRKRVVFDRERARLLQERGFSIRSIAGQLGVGVGTIHRALAAMEGQPSVVLEQEQATRKSSVVDAPRDDLALLDGIAQSQLGRSFAKASPQQKSVIRDLAKRIQNSEGFSPPG